MTGSTCWQNVHLCYVFKGLVLLSDAAKFQDLSDEFGEYNFIITDRRELQED